MLVKLNKDESKTFFEIIDSELHACGNEWDPDTNRCPSKKRIKDSAYARTIIDKWKNTQNLIPKTQLINLSNTKACSLDLSDTEVIYSVGLLDKGIKECRKELAPHSAPYTGILAAINDTMVNAQSIYSKLAVNNTVVQKG